MASSAGRPSNAAAVRDAPGPVVRGRKCRALEGLALRLDHDPHLDPVLAGELEVALVVGGHRHDRARAVAHEDEVAGPDRDLLVRERVRGVAAGENTFLLDLALEARAAVLGAQPGDLLPALGRVGEPGDERVHHRVLGGEDHERRAAGRVHPGREDTDRGEPVHREVHLRARGLPHPVLLLDEDALRPRLELRHVVEELVLVGGDPEEPLLHVALLDRVLAAPADAALRLLVGEHGEAGRAPVHGGLRPVGDAPLEHAEEHPLVPPVVLGVAGRDLAAPGVAEAEPLELPLHARDVLARPLLGVDAPLDGGVLGRQPEGVPADRVHDVEATHGLAARDDVGDAVVADVADVDVARGVGQHLEAVELRPLRVLRDLEGALVRPPLLPARFDVLEVVVAHGDLSPAGSSQFTTRVLSSRGTPAGRVPRDPPRVADSGCAPAREGVLGAPKRAHEPAVPLSERGDDPGRPTTAGARCYRFSTGQYRECASR